MMTPWMEAIETKSGKLFYRHTKTDATAWVLPKGAVLDTALSLQNKITHLRERLRAMQAVARQVVPRDKHELRVTVQRGGLLEESLGALRVCSAEELLAGPLKITFANEVSALCCAVLCCAVFRNLLSAARCIFGLLLLWGTVAPFF